MTLGCPLCDMGTQTRAVINPADPKGPLVIESLPCPVCRPQDWQRWAKKGKA